MPEVESERLKITSLSLDRVHAAMTDPKLLADVLDARIPEDWPGPDFQSLLPILAQQLLEDPLFNIWTGLIIERNENMLIGDIGFKSPPGEDGTVEIGYSIVPACRGRGYATEAARAMIEWAFRQPGVNRVTANCLNDNIASIRVLEAVGMHQVGRNGPLLDWALDRQDIAL